ncbi:MAG: hypothetical protein JXA18_09460 [Chitinispirillaceae bacterium]|nr:hypothetical protein [Chitinispirillaceae bacterium]
MRHGIRIELSFMETIAVTEWNDLISPLYDAACRLLIVRADGKRTKVNVKTLSLSDKSDRCVKEGVSVVICGAISTVARMLLEVRGITVLSWVSGPIEAIIDSYRKGNDVTALFAMPGRHRGRRADGKHRRSRRRGRAEAPMELSTTKKEHLP